MAEEEKKREKAKPPAAGKPRDRKKAAVAPEEDPDALMTVSLRAMEWAQKHRKHIVYAIAGVIAASGIAYGVYFYRSHREEQATALVTKGVVAELSPIRTGDEDPEIARRMKFYGSEAEKQAEALAAFGEARQKFGDTGPGILARLGEAGLFLDRREWDQAIAAYTDVKNTSLSAADPSVRIRVLEGLGYAREGKGLVDDARASYVELANVDSKGAKALGLYHQARIDLVKGDKPAAIDKLKTARTDVDSPGAPSSKYLKDQIDKLLGRLDPTAVPKPAAPPGGIPGLPPGAGPGGKLTKEQIDAFLKSMGSGMPGGMPKMPPGAPPMPPGGGAPPPPPPGGNP
jgi:hypothetical protein